MTSRHQPDIDFRHLAAGVSERIDREIERTPAERRELRHCFHQRRPRIDLELEASVGSAPPPRLRSGAPNDPEIALLALPPGNWWLIFSTRASAREGRPANTAGAANRVPSATRRVNGIPVSSYQSVLGGADTEPPKYHKARKNPYAGWETTAPVYSCKYEVNSGALFPDGKTRLRDRRGRRLIGGTSVSPP